MAVVTPDMPEIFEEAFERAGLEMRTGYDLKTARRSLNLLTLEWQNRGLNLFTIEAGTLAVTAGTAAGTAPSSGQSSGKLTKVQLDIAALGQEGPVLVDEKILRMSRNDSGEAGASSLI